jgi:3'(2'), 5'-bisphosphate nucleotidase
MSIEPVIRTAKKAGKRILELQGAVDTAWKADSSPVTRADKEASQIIYESLHEESFGYVDEERQRTGLLRNAWVVDPLDGTKEYITDSDEYTVNIARVEQGTPVLGVVYAPRKQKLYVYDGTKSFLEENGERTKLSCQSPPLQKAVFTASKKHRDERVTAVMDRAGASAVLRAGSSLKGCYVAEGRADVYVRVHNLHAWDIAAMHAVLRGAKGDLRPLAKKSYAYDDERVPSFVCGSKKTIRRVKAIYNE